MACSSIYELPDDIICCIFSNLTVRDAFRARLSSPRWRHLPDTRSVVMLDSVTVFGKEIAWQDQASPALQSRFVRLVNDFIFGVWAGQKMHTLSITFALGNQHFTPLRLWIAKAVMMQVEKMELRLHCSSQQAPFTFVANLICSEQAPYMKHLWLNHCKLLPAFFSRTTSWLSNLTSLVLFYVPLRQRGLDCILSVGTNLISLDLFDCELPKYLRINTGQLVCLKNFLVCDCLLGIELNCPSLEEFRYHGTKASIRFVHVPVLRMAQVYSSGSCSLFSHLIKQAPNLKSVALTITTEVQPILWTSSLKRVMLLTVCGFDLFTITNLINACPLLEKLQMPEWSYRDVGRSMHVKRQYIRPHYNLKEAMLPDIDNGGMELAIYILRNAVALVKMWVAVPRAADACARDKVKALRQRRREINPTAELRIREL